MAKRVCADLAFLWNRRDRPGAHVDVLPEALSLYHDEPTFKLDTAARLSPFAEALDGVDLPREQRESLTRLVLAEAQAAHEVERLRVELRDKARALADIEEKYRALRETVYAKMSETAARCPDMAAAVDAFAAHLRRRLTAKNATYHVNLARDFAAGLPEDVRKPVHVTPAHVGAWLDRAPVHPDKPATSRARRRVRIGRFLNWAAKQWGFTSPMKHVEGATRGQVARERGEIHWHDLEEIDAALAELPSLYWRALVSTLAFAGLRLAELCWLRRADLEPRDGGGMQIRVTNVTLGKSDRHAVKTGQERRVPVHAKRLQPIIEEYLAAGLAGDTLLFPIPAGVRRRPRKRGHPERWNPDKIAGYLTGIRRKGSKPRAGLLPAGMSAASLRRTFGSLLLRSGRSEAEVAAVMGNTPGVVRAHYARILGREVDVDF